MEIKEFILKFFGSLKSKINDEGNSIVISEVPESFEKFYGKKSPYYFCFESEKENYEFVNKSSFIIKSINDFLKDRGQTTILKIEFDFDPEKELNNRYKMINCQLQRSNKNNVPEYFLRFTFLTEYQYLNKKDQEINHIYIRKGKIFDFDLEKYETNEGKKSNVKVQNIDVDYAVAKEKLKELLKEKTQSISSFLRESLDKEISRIKEHYLSENKEFFEKLYESEAKLKELEEKNSQTEDERIKQKIFKLKEEISKLKSNEDQQKNVKEEEFFVDDEKRKHSLNIKTKLINTTIIYYNQMKGHLFFKNKKANRIVNFEFEPLEEKLSGFFCDSCKVKLEELILCGSGHLTCRQCGVRCESCNEIYCNLCLKKVCAESKKTICDSCAIRCVSCGNWKDKNYFLKTSEGQNVCIQCGVRCECCREFLHPNSLRERNNKKLCAKCIAKEVGREIVG